MGMPFKEKVLLAWMAPVALVALVGQPAASLAREAEQIRANGLPELVVVGYGLALLVAGVASVVVRVRLDRVRLFRGRLGGWLTFVLTTVVLQPVAAGLCAVLGAVGTPPVLSTGLVVMASTLPAGLCVLLSAPMFASLVQTPEAARAARPASASAPSGGQSRQEATGSTSTPTSTGRHGWSEGTPGGQTPPTSRPVTAPPSEADVARRTLGLSAGASAAEVRSAYRRLAKLHHPDKGGDAEAFQHVQRAYERLARV